MNFNNINKKLILKRIGGNFELLEILVQLPIKKISFLKYFSFTENNNPPASIEPMTPTEAEILLSSKLAEKRSSVLSDEQAEEVSS